MLNVPAGQSTGAAFVDAQLDPAGQLLQVEAPEREYCPAEHATGTVEHVPAQLDPAGQGAQGSSGPMLVGQ